VLDHYSAADFAFPMMTLIVHTEFAIALAGLGRHDDAQAQLGRLHALHAANGNPLTLAMLHDAGVKIALIARDLPAAREELARLERAYQPIRSPSAAQYCQQLAARIEQPTLGPLLTLGSVDAALTVARKPANSDLARWIELQLAAPNIGLEQRAQLALQLLADQVQASDGALYFVQDDASLRLAAALTGGRPSEWVEAWLGSQLARELADDETRLTSQDDRAHAASDVTREGELSHRLLFLRSRKAGGHGVIGLMLLSRASDAPLTCARTVVDAVAQQLHKALASEEPELDTVAVALR
jgi:hypothetical protein